MARKTRWIIEVFRKRGEDDFILAEIHLHRANGTALRRILGVPKSVSLFEGEWPIPEKTITDFEALAGVRLMPEKYNYHLSGVLAD